MSIKRSGNLFDEIKWFRKLRMILNISLEGEDRINYVFTV